MKIKALAVQDTAFLHLRNVDSQLLHESTPQGDQPVGITLYGPGTKIYANALAAKQARLVERMRKRDKQGAPTATEAEEDAAGNVQLLVEVTASFQHIEYDAPDGTPLAGAALYKAVYSSQPLGFIAEQATRFLSSWANFKPASATN